MDQYELIKKWEKHAEECDEEGRSLLYEDDSTTVWRRESLFAEALAYRKCANDLKGMTY